MNPAYIFEFISYQTKNMKISMKFLGYYERLITGQLDFKWSGDDASGGRGGKRASFGTLTSDSTPESDSVSI